MSEIDTIEGGATTRSGRTTGAKKSAAAKKQMSAAAAAKRKAFQKAVDAKVKAAKRTAEEPSKLGKKEKALFTAMNARLLPHFNAKDLSEAQIRHIVSRAHAGARRAAIEAAQEALKYKSNIKEAHSKFTAQKKAWKGKMVTKHVLASRLARRRLQTKKNGIGMVAMMGADAAKEFSQYKAKAARSPAAMAAASPMQRRAILFYETAAQKRELGQNHADLRASAAARKEMEASRAAAIALFRFNKGDNAARNFAASLDRVHRMRQQCAFDAQERRIVASARKSVRAEQEAARKKAVAERKAKRKADAKKKKAAAAKKKKEAAKKKKAAAAKKAAAKKAAAKKKAAPKRKKSTKKKAASKKKKSRR